MNDGKGKFYKKIKLDKNTWKIVKLIRKIIMEHKDGCNKKHP